MDLRLLSVVAASHTLLWLRRLGGPGLILLGLADNSVIPMPGSMDALTIWLAASHRDWWPYYALMATAGAVLGGYVTYRLAREGGKEMLERKLSKDKADKLYKKFERWGFWAVTLPAILPPPFPTVPALLAAGAMQYSRKKFLGALAVGSGIRFTIVAYFGARYGRHVLGFFSKYYKPALLVLIGFSVIAGLFCLFQYLRFRRENKNMGTKPKGVPRHKIA